MRCMKPTTTVTIEWRREQSSSYKNWYTGSSQFTNVEWYITGCLSCARHAPAQWSQLLQPIVTHHPFQLLIMDFIDSMKKTVSAGYKYILHIMNYFSRYSMTYFSATANVSDIIQVLNNVFCQYTWLEAFFLNQDQHFENQVAKEYMEEWGIKLLFKLSETLKSFDLIECGNQILEDIIQKSASFSSRWDIMFLKVTHEINSQMIGHLQYSSLSILMRLLPSSPMNTLLRDSSLTEATVHKWVKSIQDPQSHTQAVQNHLINLAAQRIAVTEADEEEKVKIIKQYNQRVMLRKLLIEDLILLHQKESVKLEACWRGSFAVIKVKEHISFHLQQIGSWRIKWTYYDDNLQIFKLWTGHLSLLNKLTYPTSQTSRRWKGRTLAVTWWNFILYLFLSTHDIQPYWLHVFSIYTTTWLKI